MENIETGLLLMAVGMTTVFIILFIVINLGKGLILLVNRYAPEETSNKKKPPVSSMQTDANSPIFRDSISSPSSTASESHASDFLSPLETAVIVAAISATTAGQGKITRIEKI